MVSNKWSCIYKWEKELSSVSLFSMSHISLSTSNTMLLLVTSTKGKSFYSSTLINGGRKFTFTLDFRIKRNTHPYLYVFLIEVWYSRGGKSGSLEGSGR
jgi:hypothetical protein